MAWDYMRLIFRCSRCGTVETREQPIIYFMAIPDEGTSCLYNGPGVTSNRVHRCDALRVGLMLFEGFDLINNDQSGMEPMLGGKRE